MDMTLQIGDSAIVEVSSSDPAIPNRKLTGTIRARLNRILMVVTGEEIAVSAAIRVQSKDLLAMGKVVECVYEQEATWIVYVGVECSMLVL